MSSYVAVMSESSTDHVDLSISAATFSAITSVHISIRLQITASGYRNAETYRLCSADDLAEAKRTTKRQQHVSPERQ